MNILDITAYMDESGASSDSDFVCIGGLVAAGEAWEMLEYEWREALEEFEITDFHMKFYAHSSGQYKKWKGDQERRNEVYGRFMRLVYDAQAMPFGAVVPMVAWRKWSKTAQDAMRDPYFICLQYCIDAAAHRAELIGLPRDETIAAVFSRNRPFEAMAGNYWTGIKNASPWGDRLGNYIFDDAKRVGALQAADIVAYEIRKYHEDLIKRPGTEPRWGYQRILALSERIMGLIMIKYYGEEDLEKFGRWIEEDVQREREELRSKRGRKRHETNRM